MEIENHLLKNVPFIESPNRGGVISPKFVVEHYTAGYNAESAIDTFKRRGNASAHVVIDLDGSITQMVPFNVKAWHAGPSKYQGYSGLNNYAIGIEIVNIGWLRKTASGNFKDDYGNIKTYDINDMVKAEAPRVGAGMFYWPKYPDVQLEVAYQLTKLLIETYNLIDVVSHEEIDTRGWKTDPGPAFPMNKFKKLTDDRSLDHELFEVTASSLNVRNGPFPTAKVVDSLNNGIIVKVLDKEGAWAKINDDEWVHSGYLRRI